MAGKCVRKKSTGAKKKAVKYSCDVCGLVVSVDQDCSCVDVCDIICCGKEMNPKK